jgi:hypothetical protein
MNLFWLLNRRQELTDHMPPQFCLIGSVASFFVHSRGISSFVRMYYGNILQCNMTFCHLDVPSAVLKHGYSSRGTFSRALGK